MIKSLFERGSFKRMTQNFELSVVSEDLSLGAAFDPDASSRPEARSCDRRYDQSTLH